MFKTKFMKTDLSDESLKKKDNSKLSLFNTTKGKFKKPGNMQSPINSDLTYEAMQSSQAKLNSNVSASQQNSPVTNSRMQVHIDHYAEAQLQAKQAEKTKKLKHKRKNEKMYASMKHTDLTIKAGIDDAALIYQTIDSN